jgi:SAM-dependent methyltransferase
MSKLVTPRVLSLRGLYLNHYPLYFRNPILVEFMSDTVILKVPEKFRRGGYKEDEHKSVESGRYLIEFMCEKLGIADLSDVNLLDIGCGNKFVQAILNGGLPIKNYVGIDIQPGLIEYLQSNVTDDRFTFYVSNTRNEMYNPEGEPLSGASRLPLEEGSFDIICLFSVFTHLAPDDYVGMLKLLRRYIKPEGKVFFTLFVNETTAGGHGFIDRFSDSFSALLTEEDMKRGLKGPPDFIDMYTEKPLWRAVYSRENAIRLAEGTGWEIESFHDPEEHIQHSMICKPT